MKEQPRHFPMCDFSGQVVQILITSRELQGLNVLESDDPARGHQFLFNWADRPAALCEGRVRRRCDTNRARMFQAVELQRGSSRPGRAGQERRFDLSADLLGITILQQRGRIPLLPSQLAGEGAIPSSPVALIPFTPWLYGPRTDEPRCPAARSCRGDSRLQPRH